MANWLVILDCSDMTTDNAKEAFNSHQTDHWRKIHPDLRRVLYQMVDCADDDGIQMLAKYYGSAGLDVDEKLSILAGFAHTKYQSRNLMLFVINQFALNNISTNNCHFLMSSRYFVCEMLEYVKICNIVEDLNTFSVYLKKMPDYMFFELLSAVRETVEANPEFAKIFKWTMEKKEELYKKICDSEFNKRLSLILEKYQ
eukprot:TRINITY_DN12045_c0_g1_i1.p1 TRINITY_DN12045_c0_g1~~TRINITY_DN12045_c0_g1_i1.p1  ORF type:complete len:199 (-),score=30.14 TRINITY_DN12045_c0_g1_i1:144-740(-)